MCNPKKEYNSSPEEWAELQAQWAEQQRSPFVLYKLARAPPSRKPPHALTNVRPPICTAQVKPLEEGGVRDPTPEELDGARTNA